MALPQSAPAAAPWAPSGAEEGTAGVGGQVSPFPLLSSRGVERVPGPEALASLPAVVAQIWNGGTDRLPKMQQNRELFKYFINAQITGGSNLFELF